MATTDVPRKVVKIVRTYEVSLGEATGLVADEPEWHDGAYKVATRYADLGHVEGTLYLIDNGPHEPYWSSDAYGEGVQVVGTVEYNVWRFDVELQRD
jgi:hypothetical protein